MGRVCHCGSSELERDATRGDVICVQCGTVLEESTIINDVQYAARSGGATAIVGQYVSSTGPNLSLSNLGESSTTFGLQRQSRAITLDNAKKRIRAIGVQLRLNTHCMDMAFNFYKMALSRQLTKRRPQLHVAAALLYIVCRSESTPHMLLDFSEILQINVFVLGRTYLYLSNELHINIPALDPGLYIHRFAHKLEFGEKTHDVSMTALRMVGRMKRDWMAQGRRPSGLCGAALLVSARIHNFNRTIKQVIRVVKIGEATIRKRLYEFEKTPSSDLTIEEFQNVDLEDEVDPPCFTEGKQKIKELQLEKQFSELSGEISELQQEIEDALERENQRRSKRKQMAELDSPILSETEDHLENDPDLQACNSLINDLEKDTQPSPKKNARIEEPKESNTDDIADDAVEELKQSEWERLINEHNGITPDLGPRPTAASLGLTESVAECMSVPEEKESKDDDGELDLSGLDDDELDQLILTPKEVKLKTKIWMSENGEYLKELKEKEEKKARDIEQGIEKPQTKKRKKAVRRKGSQREANTAGEAIEKMLQEKKISNKINYEVLKDLNRNSSNTNATDKLSAASKTQSGPLTTPSPLPKFKGSLLATPLDIQVSRFKKNLEEHLKPSSTSNSADFLPEVKASISDVVIESGPVEYLKEDAEPDVDDEDDEDEEQEHLSAAQLLGNVQGYDEAEVYDEY